MTVKQAFDKCDILKDTKASSKSKLMFCGVMRKYKKGEMIFLEREDVLHFYFLVSGYIALYKTNHNLDRKVIFVYGAGEMLNEVIMQQTVASVSCMALTDVIVLSFPRKEFLNVMEGDFELTKRIMDSLSIKLRRCYHQLGNTTNAMHLDRQAASKLWKLAKDFGVSEDGCVKINFELSITFFADMVGSKRETVSRVVKKFTESGFLAIEKNYFYIKDMEALRKYVVSE